MQATTNKNFNFIDTIRCISMMGIVWEHSSRVSIYAYNDHTSLLVQSFTIQVFKFSTIAFFLIAGFLINHKFQEYSAKQYLSNRYKNTVKPWLFWVLVFVLITIIDRLFAWHRGTDVGILFTNFPLYFYNLMEMVLFFTPYWFILNFLLCITILLIFKRYLYKIWFGVVLGLISFVYSINLYYRWFETTHSAALFGFVFFLWLGVYLNKYFQEFKDFVFKLSWLSIVLALLVTLALSMAEAFYLANSGLKDAYNTLRITNVAFSLVAFIAIFKIGYIKTLAKLKPRETTFGIYLIHYIILERGMPLIFQPFKIDFDQLNVWENTAIVIARFLLAYAISLYLTKFLSKTKLRWTVGQ